MANVRTIESKRRTKSGAEILPKVADEAERGYALTKARCRRLGRPS